MLDTKCYFQGVDDTKAAQWYAGKRVAYVYRAQKAIQGSKIRVSDSRYTNRIRDTADFVPRSYGARSPGLTATLVL